MRERKWKERTKRCFGSETMPLLGQDITRHASSLASCLKSSLRLHGDKDNAEEILRVTVKLIGDYFSIVDSSATLPHLKALMASLLARMEDKKK